MAGRLPFIFLNVIMALEYRARLDGRDRGHRACAGVILFFMGNVCLGATLSGQVGDAAGQPLADVVVTATPTGGPPLPLSSPPAVRIELDQKGREFVPHILPVHVGTPISFPNSDDIQHHVYSFSSAKRFEIKLYSGTPAKPEVFDRPGVVAIGCNIHDWMLGYVYVTEAPYYTKSNVAGHWTLEVPSGEYQIELWHPDAASSADLPHLILSTASATSLQHVIKLKARRQTGKPPDNIQEQGYSDGF